MKTHKIWQISLIILSFALSGCGNGAGGNTNTHTHYTNSDRWDYDANRHWHTCDECGEIIDQENHDFEQTIVNPTFEADGLVTYTCKYCGYSYSEKHGDKLEHSYSDKWTSDAKTNTHFHQCTDPGYEYLRKDEATHTYEETVIPPTYLDVGYTEHVCSVCGDSYTTDYVDALEHHYSDEWSHNDEGHYHQCIDEGYDVLYVDFSKHAVESWHITDFENMIKEGNCKDCGYLVQATFEVNETERLSNFVFELKEDDTYRVSYRGSIAKLEIPGCFNHKLVTEIEWIYSSGTTLKEIVVPDTIVTIDRIEVSSLEKINLPNSVLEIDDSAFSGCGITSITLPINLETIGEYTFEGCTSLESVTFNSNLKSIGQYAFYGCTSLKNVTIPEGVTTIGYEAFRYSGVETLTLPKTLVSAKNSFRDCQSLKTIYFNSVAFECDYYTRPFYDTNNVENIIFGNEVKVLSSYLFFRFEKIEYLDIPDSVEEIENSAFGACYALLSIILGRGLKSVSESAFLYNEVKATRITEVVNLSEYDIDNTYFDGDVVILSSKDDIGRFLEDDGFLVYNGKKEKVVVGYTGTASDIVIEDGTTRIRDYAFSGNVAKGNDNIKSVSIPSSVKYIGENAFCNCQNLKTLNLSEGLEIIDDMAFSGCSSLDKIELPNSLTRIGWGSFSKCAIEELTIPENVEYVGRYAFLLCNQLKTVYWNAISCECDEEYESGIFANQNGYGYPYNTSINEIIFGDSVVSVKNNQSIFAAVEKIYSVTIGANVEDHIYLNRITELINLSSDDYSEMRSINYFDRYLIDESQKGTITTEGDYVLYSFDDEQWAIDYLGNELVSEIPNGVTSLRDGLYKDYQSNLYYDAPGSITIPATVKSIEDKVFRCYRITEVINLSDVEIELVNFRDKKYFSSDLFNVDNYAYRLITSRNDAGVFTVKDNIVYYEYGNNKIAVRYFLDENNEGPSDIVIDEGTTAIKEVAFYSDVNRNNAFFIKTVTMPDTVTYIGSEAFYQCNIISIKFSNSLEYIGSYAFSHCSSLTKLEFPNSLDYIGGSAFSYCSNLKEVVFPDSLYAIGSFAFKQCTSLEIAVLPDSIVEKGSNIFSGCPLLNNN